MSQNTTAMQRGAGGETTGATDMTTRQPEALPALIERFRGLHFDHAPDGWPAVRTREITALLDRITELESQLAQRFDAADVATAAAQQGAAYAALPDEGEPWCGHKFKEVQRGCWRCDCGKTIKEVTSDQSTPASGGNYPVMPKRYTVDDDGEELFTAEKMRAFADATHALRASHGQAPAGAAHAADSAQEDAALWHGLAEYLVGPRTDLDDELIACPTVDELRKLVDADLAARKQGTTP